MTRVWGFVLWFQGSLPNMVPFCTGELLSLGRWGGLTVILKQDLIQAFPSMLGAHSSNNNNNRNTVLIVRIYPNVYVGQS